MFFKQKNFKLAPFKNKLYSPDIPIWRTEEKPPKCDED